MKIVASQTANFDQATGQKVMAQLLQSHPNINGLYAENDTMALGAIQAMRAAGKKPGKDIQIVSIDGIRDAVRASPTAPSTPTSRPTRASARSPSRRCRTSTAEGRPDDGDHQGPPLHQGQRR